MLYILFVKNKIYQIGHFLKNVNKFEFVEVIYHHPYNYPEYL